MELVVSGIRNSTLLSRLRWHVRAKRPTALGIASAFVSVKGVRHAKDILAPLDAVACRLIAGTDNFITHPEALRLALDSGWEVRLASHSGGIFHPKILAGGAAFDGNGGITRPNIGYVGSSNLTRGGLEINIECGSIYTSGALLTETSRAFKTIWSSGIPVTPQAIDQYAEKFAEMNRRRLAADLITLNVDDNGQSPPSSAGDLKTRQTPSEPVVQATTAAAVWAGLQSFTGEYRLQVEFPRTAGNVLHALFGPHAIGNNVALLCDDNQVRTMIYRYYHDNSMSRLNINNDVPNAQWARQCKDGLAIISKIDDPRARFKLEIVKPGVRLNNILARSFALGTWARTPTRVYGWF
jgi:HKD family nuclease